LGREDDRGREIGEGRKEMVNGLGGKRMTSDMVNWKGGKSI